jgi:anhydro-N-acetylmuramic acid kinase
MDKNFTALGLMSGTSMDGVDASVILSNGKDSYERIFDKYYEYDSKIYKNLTNIRKNIITLKDLTKHSKLITDLEREITLYHASVSKEIIESCTNEIDLIGFHGQTIYHNPVERISKQIGDGNLLSSLLKKKIVYRFRDNDINNGGQGAPLAPIFHQLLIKQNEIELPTCILNIGGIANITNIFSKEDLELISYDIGPGNCLLDELVRSKINKRYDEGGSIAKGGKTDELILNQAIDNFENIYKEHISYDIKDFSLNFVRGLSLEDGLSTLTDYTATIISFALQDLITQKNNKLNVLVCGGGRKNIHLINNINRKTPKNININLIDDYNIDGDFIESQAFAYLAIRSYLKLPISFPKTTNVKEPCTGGILVKNF